MAGYDYHNGMSNNAVAAYEDGLFPLSRLTKAYLIANDIKVSKNFAVWLAKENYWRSAEWHHTGGSWYNAVDFYNLDDLIIIIKGDQYSLYLNEYKESLDSARLNNLIEETEVMVTGSYVIWGGSRRHPRRVGNEPFTGILRGDWIQLASGARKKASSQYVNYTIV